MAASQRGRKKTQSRRRQNCYGRSSQQKQKRQARGRPVQKRGRSSHEKKSSPSSYDSKMLKQLKRGNRHLSNQAKGLMINFMNDIYTKVSTEAERLRRQSRCQTVTTSQVKAAMQQVMPEKWAKCSVTPVSRRYH